jgi:hypothetical protein
MISETERDRRLTVQSQHDQFEGAIGSGEEPGKTSAHRQRMIEALFVALPTLNLSEVPNHRGLLSPLK